MAVYKIEEKILGRLAKQTAPSNALLSSSFYQVLGLSILLTRSLKKARKRRRPDATPDAKLIQLSHHIIWLAREGLSITEVYILPYCQDGEQGSECRVMAASLRASFYNVFCLYHNHPPIGQLSARSPGSGSPQSSVLSPRSNNAQSRRSPGTASRNGRDSNERSKRAGKAPLRDAIPSMVSDTSYVTNPYAGIPSQTPPPSGPPPPIPTATRRAPTRPPGLTPIDIPESQSAASFLLPPLNFIPLAREHFDTALHLASSLLPPAHALRLTVAFEYAAFLWDCAKDTHRSRRVAKRAIKDVYASSDGLSDQEFVDASLLVQLLGGAVRRGMNEPPPEVTKAASGSSDQRTTNGPTVDRLIAISPPQQPNRMASPGMMRNMSRTPERLSTVPEVDSVDTDWDSQTQAATSPPMSRLSSRSRQRRASSSASAKEGKWKAVEQAEEQYRRSSSNGRSQGSGGGSPPSRQPTPQEGYVAKPRHRSSRNGNR